jgi:DNA repair exonuclease SbcCD ATPase subunit
MAIAFKKLRWKNFLSTGNSFVEMKLNEHNTTLIVGFNGAGKSTFLDALSFVLYNKPFRKINKPQLINSINKKDLVVEVEFDIGPHQYKIVRGLKPNVFEVYQNDKLLNQDAETKDYQETLENYILKLNHKSFCQVVVLGSASFIPFMQLTAANRREVIEDLLDIQIFSTMNSLLKDDVTENNKKIQKVEYDYMLTSEKIRMQQDYISAIQKNADEQILKLLKELEDVNDQIVVCVQKTNNLEDKFNRWNSKLEELNENKVRNKKQKMLLLFHQMNDNIKKLEHDIQFFDSHNDCPTCKQVIQSEFKSSTIAEKHIQIEEMRDGISKMNVELEKIDVQIRDIELIKNDITSNNINMAAHKNTYDGLKSYTIKLGKEIENLKNKSDTIVMNEDMKQLDSDLETYMSEKNELLKQKDAYQIAAAILKDSGIKARIIKQYVPIINKLINKYLSAMDFFVQFELDENFNETIKSRHRDEFSYSSFSEGEKMRINLAILFAWRSVAKLRNSAATNILIMDEVLDSSMDHNGTTEFMKILNELTKETNAFIISHKSDQMIDKFSNVIKFEKHKNFSRIVA